MSFDPKDWTGLDNTNIGEGSILSATTMRALYENLIAALQRAAGAPQIIPAKWDELTGSGNYTVPDNVTRIEVLVVGGGGGGGGTSATGDNPSAAGGTGGVVAYSVIDVTPGQTISYESGGGGSGASRGNNDGSSGGDSSFGDVVAKGGPGGGGASGSSSTSKTFPSPTSVGDFIHQPPLYGRESDGDGTFLTMHTLTQFDTLSPNNGRFPGGGGQGGNSTGGSTSNRPGGNGANGAIYVRANS